MLRLLFTDDPAGGGGAAPAADPAPPVPEPDADLSANDPDGEGTTPAEVAKVLKSSGIDVPVDSDEEEGNDPDVPAADEEKPDDPEDDEEEPDVSEDEDEEKPEAKPARQAPEDLAADEDKYSFEITDANNVTFKISVGAKMEDILAEFEPKNNGQVIDILNQLQKLENQKTADEAKAEEDKATAAKQERSAEFLKSWAAEAKDLTAQKRIPEGTDGQKRIDAVYKYMSDENTKRMEAGKPTINSFEDALDKLEAKEGREAKAEQDKKDKETARENGGKVGGSSSASTSGTPAYKGGARNSNEALRAMGLLKT